MSDPLSLLGMDTVTFDLARPYVIGMPQSPNHPAYWHSYPRRHGDRVRADGGSAANDVITTGTHVGTHIDALVHVSQDGAIHGGVTTEDALVGGRYAVHGIDAFPPGLHRGVLLDVPRALGLEACEPGYEIVPDDLDRAVAAAGVEVRPGDVLLVRSGWGRRWDEGPAYVGLESGVPGVSEAGARWLAERRPRAAGADSIAFERLAPGAGHGLLPAHRVLLVEAGINIIETLDLEGVAAAGATEFLLVLAPLPLVGATGSPVRPLAVAATSSLRPAS